MKQTTFSCPFSRSSPPLHFHCGLLQDPSRPEEKPQRISQTQDPRKAEVRLNLSPARGTEGRSARPDAPAARRRDGPRRTCLRAQHPASAGEQSCRGAARPGLRPPPLRLCLPVVRLAVHQPAGSEPGFRHRAVSAGSGQQTPGRVASTEN